MKKINNKACWLIARGTCEENVVYCSKDKEFEERGTKTINGKKKVDLVLAVKQKLEGKSTMELIDEHGAGFIMNKRKIDECVNQIQKEENCKSYKVKKKANARKRLLSRFRSGDSPLLL